MTTRTDRRLRSQSGHTHRRQHMSRHLAAQPGKLKYHALLTVALFLTATIQVNADPPPRKARGNITLHGVVLSQKGKPVRGANVGVAKYGEGRIGLKDDGVVEPSGYSIASRDPIDGTPTLPIRTGTIGTAVTDEKGIFEIDGLSKGKYKLVAGHHKRGWFVLDEFVLSSSNDDPLEITLEPGM